MNNSDFSIPLPQIPYDNLGNSNKNPIQREFLEKRKLVFNYVPKTSAQTAIVFHTSQASPTWNCFSPSTEKGSNKIKKRASCASSRSPFQSISLNVQNGQAQSSPSSFLSTFLKRQTSDKPTSSFIALKRCEEDNAMDDSFDSMESLGSASTALSEENSIFPIRKCVSTPRVEDKRILEMQNLAPLIYSQRLINESAYLEREANDYSPSLKNSNYDASYGVNTITPEQLSKMLNQNFDIDSEMGEENSSLEKKNILLLDCRFDYEYIEGHIENGIHINHPSQLDSILFSSKKEIEQNIKDELIIIFYCEFCQKRSVEMYKHLRKVDRMIHSEKYPAILYSDIYILKGGYCEFYKQFPKLCNPSNYLEMKSKPFRQKMLFNEAERKRSFDEYLISSELMQ